MKELLVAEEETVTVDQDLIRLEVGATSQKEEAERGNEEPKSAASEEQPTASQPSRKHDQGMNSHLNEEPDSASEKLEPSPQPKTESPQPAELETKRSQGSEQAVELLGNREERRVF